MLFSVPKGVRHNCGFLLKNAVFAGLVPLNTRPALSEACPERSRMGRSSRRGSRREIRDMKEWQGKKEIGMCPDFPDEVVQRK